MDMREAAHLMGYDLQGVDMEQWHGQQDCEAQRYEEELMDEARRIVAGESSRLPSREHLRVALAWLDGHEPQPEPPGLSGPGVPF